MNAFANGSFDNGPLSTSTNSIKWHLVFCRCCSRWWRECQCRIWAFGARMLTVAYHFIDQPFQRAIDVSPRNSIHKIAFIFLFRALSLTPGKCYRFFTKIKSQLATIFIFRGVQVELDMGRLGNSKGVTFWRFLENFLNYWILVEIPSRFWVDFEKERKEMCKTSKFQSQKNSKTLEGKPENCLEMQEEA